MSLSHIKNINCSSSNDFYLNKYQHLLLGVALFRNPKIILTTSILQVLEKMTERQEMNLPSHLKQFKIWTKYIKQQFPKHLTPGDEDK